MAKTKLNKPNKNKCNKSKKHKKTLSSSGDLFNKMKLYKNGNGTKLLIMPTRKETETASLYFYFKVGSKNETPEVYGISHFIEHMLYKGSINYPNYLDISKTFDSHGISFNAYTSKDITAYHYKFLSTKENIDLICNITSDILFNSLMRQKDITPERNVIVQEYNDGLDDIDNVVNDTIEECIFEGHPLGPTIIGTPKSLKDINKKELTDYYNKYYIPDNLVISFSGCFQSGYITIIEKHFTHALATNYKNKTNNYNNYNKQNKQNKQNNKYKSVNLNTYRQEPSQIIPFVDKHPEYRINCFPKKLTQDYVTILFKTKGYFDSNRYYYKLLNNILGGNMSSRLFVEIREKLGLAYSISCDITNYEEGGYFNIYTQNEPQDTLKCLEHIFKEIQKFKTKGINKTELEDNKKNYCNIYKTLFDDIENENEHYSHQLLFNKPFESIDMRIKAIEAITEEQLLNTANELFKFNKVHIITFGKVKKDKIEKVLKKFM